MEILENAEEDSYEYVVVGIWKYSLKNYGIPSINMILIDFVYGERNSSRKQRNSNSRNKQQFSVVMANHRKRKTYAPGTWNIHFKMIVSVGLDSKSWLTSEKWLGFLIQHPSVTKLVGFRELKYIFYAPCNLQWFLVTILNPHLSHPWRIGWFPKNCWNMPSSFSDPCSREKTAFKRFKLHPCDRNSRVSSTAHFVLHALICNCLMLGTSKAHISQIVTLYHLTH